ncbi:MAG TPA: Uma2 family endonuclease [Thermoanaerobaculia bacterium]|nr:Uma2 family endonuclease [Thermoanaerobaculia bacterium]
MALDVLPIAALVESPVSPASTLGPFRSVDYARVPDEPRCELLYGRFYLSPSPPPLHQLVVRILCRRLEDAAGPGGGIVLPAPLDTALSDHTVVQPDILYITAERSSIVREQRIEGAPDLVIEVLSPSTARRDRGEKLRAYAESGVREYWLADVAARHIEFLVNQDAQFRVVLPLDGVYRSEVFPEIVLDLVNLWNEVERRTPRSS